MDKSITVKQYLSSKAVKVSIKNLLQDRASQFIVSISSMISNNEKLATCEPKSLVSAALTATALDLPINQNLGYIFIIPYKDRKTGITYAQAQFGYKAFIQLAMRSNQFKTINVTDVREGEIADIDRLSGKMIFSWVNDKRDSLPIVGFVAYMELTNGFEKSLYMTSEELKQHGIKFSQNYKKGYGLWKDDFNVMAKKTVIKLLLSKYAPMTSALATAQEADQAIIQDSDYKYIDNLELLPKDEGEAKEKERIERFIQTATTVKELEEAKIAVYDFDDKNLIKLYVDKRKEVSKNKD